MGLLFVILISILENVFPGQILIQEKIQDLNFIQKGSFLRSVGDVALICLTFLIY